MPLHEKKQKNFKSKLVKERKRWTTRYLKKARKIKDRNYRILRSLLLAWAVLYLAAVWGMKERIFHVRQENTVILREEALERQDNSLKEALYKIIVKLKTGELVLYHERTW